MKKLSYEVPLILFGVVVLFFLWIYSSEIIILLFGVDGNDAAELGDSYAVLNTLFSAGTLLFVVYAVILQKRELKAASEALTASSDALKEQNKTQDMQRFENAFFRMIEIYLEEKKSLVVPVSKLKQTSSSNVVSGNHVYRSMYKFMNEDGEENSKIVGYSDFLFPVYLTLKPIFEYLSNNKADRKYYDILKHTMSSQEIYILEKHISEVDHLKKYEALLRGQNFFDNIT